MAQKNQAAQDAHTANIIKAGKPRTSKRFRRKGSYSRTSNSGNGKRLR